MKKLMQRFRGLFWEDYWAIGVIENHIDPLFFTGESETKVNWIKTGFSYFLADPFILDKEKRIIICEYFHLYQRVGKLALVQLNGDNSIQTIRLLKTHSRHFSYPFVTDQENCWGIIPETALDNHVRLILLDKSNFSIKEQKLLVNNYSGVDPTVVFHKNKYWMFCNPLNSFNNELNIFYAHRIEGPWVPCALQNLMIENSRSAGPAFVRENKLYRITQNNKNAYGEGILIKEIAELNENSYREKTVREIYPDKNSKYPDGLHTLCFVDNFVLLDGKKRQFEWYKPIKLICGRIYRYFYFFKVKSALQKLGSFLSFFFINNIFVLHWLANPAYSGLVRRMIRMACFI